MLIVKSVFSYYMGVLVNEVSVLLPYQIMSVYVLSICDISRICHLQTVTFQDLVYMTLWSAPKMLLSQL
jgi:hypothetical protein